MVPLDTPISQDEMDEVYGKKDENGISTDTIEIPPEELVDDYADLNAAVEGIASPIETVDGDDGIEDAFASISETDASGDYED
jgi:hypothetical protein